MKAEELAQMRIRANSEIEVFREGGYGKFYLIEAYVAALEVRCSVLDDPLSEVDVHAERIDPGHLLRINLELRRHISALESRLAAFGGWEPVTETEPAVGVYEGRLPLEYMGDGAWCPLAALRPTHYRPIHETEES